MRFRAAIFDLDGTLLNTLEDLADATNLVLRRLGYPEHDLQAYRYFVGDGLEALVEKALPQSRRIAENVQRGFDLLKSEYARRWANKTHLYPGIPELLDSLLSSGYQINILTNKADEAAQEIVAKLLPHWRFNIVRGATADTPQKPNPTSALKMARQSGLSPGEMLFIGDTASDMQAAGASGMYAIGALWGFRQADELIAGGARMLIKDPPDLLPWI